MNKDDADYPFDRLTVYMSHTTCELILAEAKKDYRDLKNEIIVLLREALIARGVLEDDNAR